MAHYDTCAVSGCEHFITTGSDLCLKHHQEKTREARRSPVNLGGNQMKTCQHCGNVEGTPHDKNCPSHVDHPEHYGGEDDPYEVIKVLKAKLSPEELRGFCKGNALKYLMRAGKKSGQPSKRDELKAQWYMNYLIENCS